MWQSSNASAHCFAAVNTPSGPCRSSTSHATTAPHISLHPGCDSRNHQQSAPHPSDAAATSARWPSTLTCLRPKQPRRLRITPRSLQHRPDQSKPIGLLQVHLSRPQQRGSSSLEVARSNPRSLPVALNTASSATTSVVPYGPANKKPAEG